MDDFIKKLIVTYHNVLNDELCNSIIDKFNTSSIKNVNNNNCNFSFLKIDTTSDNFWKEIDTLICNIIGKSSNQYLDHIVNLIKIFPYSKFIDKGYTINLYKKKIGFQDLKYNLTWNKSDGATIISFIFFLNTIDEDGEIEFANGIKIKPLKGDLLFFPSTWDMMYKHNISNIYDKYIITGDLYY